MLLQADVLFRMVVTRQISVLAVNLQSPHPAL